MCRPRGAREPKPQPQAMREPPTGPSTITQRLQRTSSRTGFTQTCSIHFPATRSRRSLLTAQVSARLPGSKRRPGPMRELLMYFGRASRELRAAAVRAPSLRASASAAVHFLTCRHDQTGLSFTQVATWFINARKRVWKPFVHDQNNDDVGSTMDVDNCAHALAFSSGASSIDSCIRASSSASFSESDSHESVSPVDHDMSPCDEKDYVPPPPPTHADRREYATVGIVVSPSRNMLCVGMISPDRSQMYVGMVAVPDPHDDYQGLELFSSCRVSSPCVSPLQGNRPSQSMQAFHNRTTPRYP